MLTDLATTDSEISLVVLDIMLPGMDGYQVCHQLRLQAETENLPIVMLTAKTGDQDRFIGLTMAEANAYLTKPIDTSRLLESVTALLETHPNSRTAAPSTRQR